MSDSPPPPPPGSAPKSARENLDAVLQEFARLQGDEGVSPQVTDAVTQALLLILGSGPAVAAFNSLLAVQQANGMMFHNAVANQQKTNLLGMAMTAKCVRYMLDPYAPPGKSLEDELAKDLGG